MDTFEKWHESDPVSETFSGTMTEELLVKAERRKAWNAATARFLPLLRLSESVLEDATIIDSSVTEEGVFHGMFKIHGNRLTKLNSYLRVFKRVNTDVQLGIAEQEINDIKEGLQNEHEQNTSKS